CQSRAPLKPPRLPSAMSCAFLLTAGKRCTTAEGLVMPRSAVIVLLVSIRTPPGFRPLVFRLFCPHGRVDRGPGELQQSIGIESEDQGRCRTQPQRRQTGDRPLAFERLDRVAQIHDRQDAQVVPGTDGGVDNADDSQNAEQPWMW